MFPCHQGLQIRTCSPWWWDSRKEFSPSFVATLKWGLSSNGSATIVVKGWWCLFASWENEWKKSTKELESWLVTVRRGSVQSIKDRGQGSWYWSANWHFEMKDLSWVSPWMRLWKEGGVDGSELQSSGREEFNSTSDFRLHWVARKLFSSGEVLSESSKRDFMYSTASSKMSAFSIREYNFSLKSEKIRIIYLKRYSKKNDFDEC